MARMTTFRTLLIVIFVCHWFVSQLDIKNKFVNSELYEKAPHVWLERFVSVVTASSFWRVLMIPHFMSTFQLMVKLLFYMSIHDSH